MACHPEYVVIFVSLLALNSLLPPPPTPAPLNLAEVRNDPDFGLCVFVRVCVRPGGRVCVASRILKKKKKKVVRSLQYFEHKVPFQ